MKNKLKSNKNKTIFQAGDHRSTTRTINGPGTVLCHIYEQSGKIQRISCVNFHRNWWYWECAVPHLRLESPDTTERISSAWAFNIPKKEQIAKMRQLQLVVEVEHYICFGISHAVSSLISHSIKEYKNQ
jgi:hypothetical protein